MIDRELVVRKLVLVQRDLDTLAPYATKTLAAYLASSVDELVVERLLERVIGRLIDVNFHLLTGSGQPPPSDYFASFVELAGIGIVDAEFARRVASCAGLRNRLVHEYEDLDPTKVYTALRTALDELPELMRRIYASFEERS